MSATKNLGLVKAVHVGTTPPSNTLMLWKDTNIGVNLMKEYDTNSSSWVPLGGNGVVKYYTSDFVFNSATTVTFATHQVTNIYSIEIYVLSAGSYTKDNSITLSYNATTKDITAQAVSYSGQNVRLRVVGY